MRESDFIKNNKEFWKGSEKQLDKKSKDTGLGDSFVRITDDLSYSQTYYNRRSIRLYLNGLATNFFNKIHSTGRNREVNFMKFWMDELPLIIYQSRIQMLVSFLVFLIAVIIGIFSLEYDEGFARQILGDHYISMTEDNINAGDPMAVYKDSNFLEMFFRIWVNNLFVSAWIYILGLLFCVGTVGILIYNGVMLGTFQYYFYKKGLFFESFLTIWQHGTIEILSIIIEGTAGLVLGSALLFPGTLPRETSLKIGAVKSLKIFLGCVPLITIAAFIESFFTRYDDLPLGIRLSVIILSFVLMFGYYVVLPFVKGRRFRADDYDISYEDETATPVIRWGEIKKNAQIFFDALILLKDHFPKWLKTGVLIAGVFSVYIVIISPQVYYLDLSMNESLDEFYIFSAFITIYRAIEQLDSFGAFFEFESDVYLWPLMSLAFTLIAWLSMKTSIKARMPDKWKGRKDDIHLLLYFGVCFFGLTVLFFSNEDYLNVGWRLLMLFVLVPILFWAPGIRKLYDLNTFQSVFKSVDLFFKSLINVFLLVLILSVLGFLIYIFFSSPFLYITFELANGFIGFSETVGVNVLSVIMLSISLLAIIIMIAVYFGGLFIFLDSVFERNTADQLMKSIRNIQTKRKIYGVESE